ncbi:ABC transporter ATP-binding protein [Desulfopila aestuarii]|uniref:Spermidine/putrescine transport system ATP-binding protein n=1 Tax=Desulfopila aestuarii DSM 18488 TaxID=1121416 RepID=A0A1M7YKX5_9BACT|nr:ABC transporter ATP-binding protein [Desulfopila aestuarii]SHO53216.1 spermidine/putrescine transport system ATP-binding protein [Desulfopila aestuarii DSM 18488]
MNSTQNDNLIINNVTKTFGDFIALKDIGLGVRQGEFFTLLGPSGCGKTTLLRIIAGLELPSSGTVTLRGQDITMQPAAKRQVNTVFQSYALFPNLTIFENVAFGLRSRKFAEDVIRKKVNATLEMLEMGEMQQRIPDQLSGGQKQRVAIARALVNEPDILLLDEPMSALDAKLRVQVQEELRKLQRKLGTTFIMVTHDQSEALVCSDRIAVMNHGEVIQCGTPEDVYDYPRNPFVARFLGAANLFKAKRVNGGVETEIGTLQLNKQPDWQEGLIAIRPEWIKVGKKPAINGVHATVQDIVYRGTDFDLTVTPGHLRVRTNSFKNFAVGDQVWLELPPPELVVLEEDR